MLIFYTEWQPLWSSSLIYDFASHPFLSDLCSLFYLLKSSFLFSVKFFFFSHAYSLFSSLVASVLLILVDTSQFLTFRFLEMNTVPKQYCESNLCVLYNVEKIFQTHPFIYKHHRLRSVYTTVDQMLDFNMGMHEINEANGGLLAESLELSGRQHVHHFENVLFRIY